MPHSMWTALKPALSFSLCVGMSVGPATGSAVGGTSFSGQLGDGGGSPDDSGLFSAIRRSGVPIVMAQSTEDALIASPLALVLKQEVGGIAVSKETASRFSACMNPASTAQETGHVSACSGGLLPW